ncbi:MAG: hypothetical protein J6O50_02485 [Ruminiclostridium sp.]|nr:hypothetical protein [Ruminiclostridium sp.]
MTKNGKRNALIGTVSAACIAMICVIGSQFIDTDNSKIVSHDAPGSDKVGVQISTTAPLIAEEENAETTAPTGSADTTRPAEGSGTDDTTAANDDIIVVAVTTTTAGNYTYPSGGMVTDTAATTAAYTTKSMVVVDQSFEEATKPVTEPPAPEVSDEAALTNADTEPTYNAEQTTVIVTTAPPTTPKNGETSGNMIYAIGFGWVVNEGGGGEGSTNDEMYCNGNKIGYFG